MELSPTSKLNILSFLDQHGNPIDVPSEWSSAWIAIHGMRDEWEHVRLIRQKQEMFPVSLRRIGNQTYIVAEWPLSGPGHYHLRLFVKDTQVVERTITIHPAKISSEAYGQLLEDLAYRLPATIALALQRNGALAGLTFLPNAESTVAMELARLRRAICGNTERAGLAQVLRALAQKPHEVLSTTQLWVPREQARRPHPSQLVQALSRCHNLNEDGKPLRILDTRVEPSVDVYENRITKIFWQQVSTRLRRLQRTLEKQTNKATLLEEVKELHAVLHSARREAVFLADVTLPTHLPTQVTMLLLRHPWYRAMLEGYLEFHRSPMVRLEEPALEAPLENLPFLYQIWGTLEVLSALLTVTENQGYQIQFQQLAHRDAQGVYLQLLSDGKPLVILEHPVHHTRISFVPEHTYTRQKATSHLHSISFEQRPDIAVEINEPDKPPRLYLFDPKYKLSGNADGQRITPKKEDIDKMHAYRDAIRDLAGLPAVRYAAILYPGATCHYSDGIAALRAYPGEENHLLEQLETIFSMALL